MRRLPLFLLVLTCYSLSGCVQPQTPVDDRNSQLTQGTVQMTLKKGQTSKAQVLESFGAPNITTRDGDGREVWTYQRSAQSAQSSKQSGWLAIVGTGGNAAGAGGASSSSSGFESTSRMITLIIKFDEHDIVTDFNSRTSNF